MIHPYGRPELAWEPWVRPSIVHVPLGADRHEQVDEPLPPKRKVGFVAPPVDTPLIWEGDDA